MAGSKSLSRRKFAKILGGGTAALASPTYVRSALSSSGELNVFNWADYVHPEIVDGFQNETGIKVNAAFYGSNDEVLSKLKASQGKGYDIVCFATTVGLTWYKSGDLLQPLDESKITGNVIPALYERSIELGATYRGRRMLMPYSWGTEAIVYNAAERDYKYGELSYDNLWDEENVGRVLVRTTSALTSIGLYLDSTGEVPSNRLLDAYKNEEAMRSYFEKYLAYAIARKKSVQNFWENAQQTLTAFQQDKCVIGQCWDGPAMRMMKETNGGIRYLMPKEGGLAWLDSLAIPSGAVNIEQTYAWINYLLRPEIGALFANKSGYNSAVQGAEAFLEADQQNAFASAYPPGAIENLWWWPPEDAWYSPTVDEFGERYRAA